MFQPGVGHLVQAQLPMQCPYLTGQPFPAPDFLEHPPDLFGELQSLQLPGLPGFAAYGLSIVEVQGVPGDPCPIGWV